MKLPKSRVGLSVGRYVPLHVGHCFYIHQMMQDCEVVIVGIGSVQRRPDLENPYTFEESSAMIRNVYGDRIEIIPLVDIGSSPSSNDWIDYVLSVVEQHGLPQPTDYYCGSEEDAMFYRRRFRLQIAPALAIDEELLIPGTGEPRRLHIVDPREKSTITATAIRQMMSEGMSAWRHYVPRVNYEIVCGDYTGR